jgi:hypothetical protein
MGAMGIPPPMHRSNQEEPFLSHGTARTVIDRSIVSDWSVPFGQMERERKDGVHRANHVAR